MLDSLLRWQLQWDDFYVVPMDDVWCSIDGVAVSIHFESYTSGRHSWSMFGNISNISKTRDQ